jgi:alpha/beta superfamily hydrolase
MSVAANQNVRLALAGYSYGSMIASHLPSVDVVLNMFRSPLSDSAEAEVCLRASNIAQLRNRDVQSRRRLEQQVRGRNSLRASDAIHGTSHAVLVGGYESESTSRRISRESSRQSLDVGVRQSLDRVRERFTSRKSSSPQDTPAETSTASEVELVAPEVCYLLVSPLLPPVTFFTTMFFSLSFAAKKKSSSAPIGAVPASRPDVELVLHPSCAVYGDRDTFASQKKLRKWAESLKQKPNSQFQFFEVNGAGHFWQEENATERMRSSIQKWLGAIDVV